MRMRDILCEWRNFIANPTILKEGGNAVAREYDSEGNIVSSTWNNAPAQARPIVFDDSITRSKFVDEAVKAIKVINKLHKDASGAGLYSDEILDFLMSGYTFMGSSEFLFSKEIPDEEYNKHKKKTGDIDLLVPKTKISSLYSLLNSIKETRLTDHIIFVGHNKVTEAQIKEEQINGIFEYSTPERSFLFQIDFVFVPFDDEGKPFEEEKFLRGSSWSDIVLGVKGIGHKLLLQSLSANIVKIPFGSALIATPTSKPDKIRLQSSLPDISNKRVGQVGIIPASAPQDLQSFGLYVSEVLNDLSSQEIRHLYNLFAGRTAKISWEEIERFFEVSKNPQKNSLLGMLKEILRKEGLAQNQNIKLLTTFIVDSPTVPDFKLQDYFKSFSSMMSFTMGRGLSVKYRKEPYQVGGKDVYRYLKFNEREKKFRKAEEIFEAIFGVAPTAQDVKDTASFVGLLRIMKSYLDTSAQIRAYEGLVFYFYESTNFMSAHSMEDDLGPKSIIMNVFEERLPAVKQSSKYTDKENILNTWIARYQERLLQN